MNTQTHKSPHFMLGIAALGEQSVDEALAMSCGQNPSVRNGLATSGWLLGLNGVHLGEDMRLYPGPNTIGSSARCHIVVTSPEAGRQHAVLDVISAESAILLPGSSHRTLFLNDQICESPSPVCHGDTIQIGDQVFVFVSLLPVPSGDKRVILFREKPTLKTPFTVGWLVEIKGDTEGRDYRLFAGENRIGSQSGLEVYLPDPDVHERHCVITRHQENWTVVPVSVTDPLYVNGVPTTGTGLENGDVLTIGNREFLFRCIKVAFSR